MTSTSGTLVRVARSRSRRLRIRNSMGRSNPMHPVHTSPDHPAVPSGEQLERVLIGGDLSKLSPEDRVLYYKRVCDSLGLNYLTQPLAYIVLNQRLVLYCKRDAADQLRRIHKTSY